MANPVKVVAGSPRDAEQQKKQTILWPPESWERIEQACQVIADQTKVECSPIALIRGATMARVDEILGRAGS